MLRRKNSARGYTLAELIAVTFIFGILMLFVVVIISPLVHAPNIQQAKIDTVETGAQAIYRLQRDIRVGQVNGVYVCTYPGPTTCSTPSASPTLASVQVLAILTPRASGNGNIQWSSSTGSPNWQGFQVYWLVPDGNGTGTYNLEYAFNTSSGLQPGAAAASADTAVNGALGSASPQVIAHNILSLQIDQDVNGKTIGLSISSQSTVGSQVNETTYTGNAFARN